MIAIEPVRLDSPAAVETTLGQLENQGRWVFRGLPQDFAVVPTIDHKWPIESVSSRAQKLAFERWSIETFKGVRAISPAELLALADPVATLSLMRHYGVPCRLVDWSRSPYASSWFATAMSEGDGVIWCIDYREYVDRGAEQWRSIPESGGYPDPNKFDAKLTMFDPSEPKPWIVFMDYVPGFPRQDAQSGCYSLCPHFGVDHVAAIRQCIPSVSVQKYIIPANIKQCVRRSLESRNVSALTLLPDPAGVAQFLKEAFPYPRG